MARIVIPVVTPTTREYDEYSVRTGKLVAVLDVRHYPRADAGGFPRLLWVNFSGSTLIVSDAPPHRPLLTANGEPTGVLAVVGRRPVHAAAQRARRAGPAGPSFESLPK
jgi:hypothetical protein